MKGSTQTWDGLRLYWERDARAAAYEIIVSDHQIFDDEVRQALAGTADFTTVVAVAPAVTCVIDNVTAREARGWYSVIARGRDGKRSVLVQHATKRPAYWYSNLVAHPAVSVDFGNGPIPAQATPISDPVRVQDVLARVRRKYWSAWLIQLIGKGARPVAAEINW